MSVGVMKDDNLNHKFQFITMDKAKNGRGGGKVSV